jgi:hypothetical protein
MSETNGNEVKAYDFKVLAEALKKEGLIQAEDAAEKVYKIIMDWVCDSATLSATPFDDIIKMARAYVDKLALEAIEQISKEDNA